MYQKYVDQLKDKGLKATQQRIEILRYLDLNRIHPTPDQVFSYAKSKFPTMSKMTVYNIIESLVGQKIINMMRFTNSTSVHVDYETDVHMHFICEKCKKIYDIKLDLDCSSEIEEMGHMANDCNVNIYGVCKKCLSKENKRSD